MSYSPLASPTATTAVLELHGFNTKKAFGQNFLVNDAIIGKIIELAAVQPDDVVLEVGPGIGTLTWALLDHARAVVAIERDPALPALLADTLGAFGDALTLIAGDALDIIGRGGAEVVAAGGGCVAMSDDGLADGGLVAAGERAGGDPAAGERAGGDLAAGGGPAAGDQPAGDPIPAAPNKLVSNLPYGVAATVVLDCFQKMGSVASATVMVQREVAERMMASPSTKSYGAYTVKLALFAEVTGSFAVGPANFMPRPHVDSTVVRLDRRDLGQPREVVQAACTMADAAFFARRKTIVNSCRQYFSGRDRALADIVPHILAAAGVDAAVRGETLTPAQFLALGEALRAQRRA